MDSEAKFLERVKNNPNDAEALYGLACYSLVKYKSEEEFLAEADDVTKPVGLDGIILLLEGKFCERIAKNGTPDPDSGDAKALDLITMSANLGWIPAQQTLSILGWMTVEAGDYQRGVSIIKKLAAQGLAEAQYNLSVLYDQGRGVPKDSEAPFAAFLWCEKAAKQGHAEAMGNLGICYLNGDGVEQNRKKAHEWFEKGAAAGNEFSAEQLRKLDEHSGSSSNTHCYVATAVYGSYNCPQVWVLRRYRDYRLAERILGRLFIRIYYAVSPTLVKWFGNNKSFKHFWRWILDHKVRQLRNMGIEDTPYVDRVW